MLKKQFPYFVFVFLLPVIAVLWWWGLFSSPSVEVTELGGYRYAYLEAKGPYSKLEDKQKQIAALLKQQHIESLGAVTLMMSDPRTMPYKERIARTGFMIAPQALPLAPLQIATVAKRKVIVVKIKAHPLFAYGKTYSALLSYLEKHQMVFALPTLEIYDHSVLQIEMEINP